MRTRPAAFVVAAPRSGEGKTTVCLALIRALAREGWRVGAAKCGPDYVDPTLLAQAAGSPCVQLDTWLMGGEGVRAVFARQSRDCDIVLVEGVMGLLDGRAGAQQPDCPEGSTLDAARALGLPVLLVVNTRGMAASLAPLARGFQLACSRAGVRLAGIIATQAGSERHRAMLAESLSQNGLPPLVCALGRETDIALPSRQLGLVPAAEVESLERTLDRLGDMIDADSVRAVLAAVGHDESAVPGTEHAPAAQETEAGRADGLDAETADEADGPDERGRAAGTDGSAEPDEAAAPDSPFEPGRSDNADKTDRAAWLDSPQKPAGPANREAKKSGGTERVLAVAQDAAFCFYYEENFALLRRLGWRVVFFSPLKDARLPRCDALYLGGGYPEVFAGRLAANASLRRDICLHAAEGREIYAECGGYMYLARALRTEDGVSHEMCGLVPGTAVMGGRLRSLGYREVAWLAPLPFGLDAVAPGRRLRGHEFHWSAMDMDMVGSAPAPLYAETKDGVSHPAGVVTGPCGNVRAGYLHAWLPSLLFCNGGERKGRACGTDAAPLPAPAGSKPSGAQGLSAAGGTGGTGGGTEAGRRCLVLVTGPSSAGKSGLVRRLAERIGERARTVSLDGLLAALGAGGRCPASLEEAERAGLLSAAGYHRLLADALAKPGLVLCDHVLCGSSAWTQDLLHRLAAKTPGARLVAIELDCPEDELRARERARSDRPADCAHAAAQRRRQAAKPLAAILETLPGTNLTILSGSSPGTGHALPAQAQPGRAAMDSVTTGSMTADCVTLDSGAAGPDALAEQAFAALERRGLLPHISRQSRQGSEV